MTLEGAQLEVVHNKEASRFQVDLGAQLAVIDYQQDNGRMVFTHTGVPPAFQGQGIAARMTEVALAYADDEGLQVIPLCSYTAAYIKRHPQYAILTSDQRDA